MLRFFPFGETFDIGMGGRVLQATEALIDVDPSLYAAQIALKRELLTACPGEYFHAGGDTCMAEWEVVELVLLDLAKHYPDRFRLERDGSEWRWQNACLGEHQTFVWDDPTTLPFAPLDWVGRQVQEDLVLVRADAEGTFVGGQLCFPNGWDINDRLGRSFLAMHAGTPQTTMPSVHAGARLLAAMKPGKTFWRLSWNFKLTDQLDLSTKHKPSSDASAARQASRLSPLAAGREVFIRVERQTFSRLQRSPYILFGIHTYNSCLDDETTDPERARRILEVVRAAPEDVKRYKAIAPIEHAMLPYLERRVVT